MDALVIDSFATFAGLGEGGENDSGVIGEKLRFLRGLAQRYDPGVLLIHHLGKDGTLRGSSAFEAEADIIVSLTRPEGRHGPSVRRLDIKGRYGLLEQNIELRDGRFISLGDDNRVEFKKAVDFIKAALPDSPDPGMRKSQLIELRKDADDISVRTLERALGWLMMKKIVGGDNYGRGARRRSTGTPKLDTLIRDHANPTTFLAKLLLPKVVARAKTEEKTARVRLARPRPTTLPPL